MALFVLCAPMTSYAACSSPAGGAGEIIYNDDFNVFQYCDDTNWIAMHRAGSGSGGCTNPTLPEGSIAYSSVQRSLIACAGNVTEGINGYIGSNRYIRVSGSSSNTCGITAAQDLYCWGTNSGVIAGEQTTPALVDSSSKWLDVAVSRSTICGIKIDNSLHCWGDNVYGQTGLGVTTGTQLTPAVISGGGSWVDISAGWRSFCGIKTDGTAWCWGGGSNGQLGNNATSNSAVPVQVSGGNTWRQVEGGRSAFCAIDSSDNLYCWGENRQLGIGSSSGNTPNPTQVSGGGAWLDVSLHEIYTNTCGIKTDGTLWCWGQSSADAHNGAGPYYVPTAVPNAFSWREISLSSYESCGITTNDDLYCWGGRNFPNTITDTGFQASAAGDDSSILACHIDINGQIFCWSSAFSANALIGSAAGNGDRLFYSEATPYPDASAWKKISNSDGMMCGIKVSDDTMWCWGEGYGIYPFTPPAVTPIRFPTQEPTSTWKTLGLGLGFGCGIKTDNTAWCWGDNWYSNLGDGTYTGSYNTPVAVQNVGTNSWDVIEANEYYDYYHACGIQSDGKMYCWGRNRFGSTGLGTTTGDATVPTEVSGGGLWDNVKVGSASSCATKTDNTLWCWGSNTGGKTGQGLTTGDTTVPTEVSGGGAWISFDVSSHACGVKSDNTLWCWGSNLYYKTGQGINTGDTSVPSQVGADTDWASVEVLRRTTCAIKTDNTAWCWGNDIYGVTGVGIVSSSSDTTAPTQIINGNNFESLSGMSNTGMQVDVMCGLKEGGKLWCWGTNSEYQVSSGPDYFMDFPKTQSPWCGEPAASAGALYYNSVTQALSLCDGVGWVAIGKGN